MMLFDLRRFENSVAIVEDGRAPITYGELREATESISDSLSARSLVFCLCENSFGSIAGYVAFMNADIVPLLLEREIDADLLQALIERYRPTHLWVPSDIVAQFGSFNPIFERYGYTLLSTNEARPYKLNEDLSLLVSTSGSTGTPKLVRLSRANLVSNTKSIIEYLRIDVEQRAITSLPMSYVYGLSVINTHLYAGASLGLTDQPCYTGKFWKLFESFGATSFAGVPFMYEMLKKLKFLQKDRPATLKTMTQAGGKLPADLQEEFARYAKEQDMNFVVMYGASEATARMGYLPPESALDKPGSMGIAIPGGRFDIEDDKGNLVSQGEVGELVYYGDNVSLGYSLEGADLEKGDENHGRLTTGDMAYHDEDGYYFIVGRKKRFVKMLGKRVNLDESERLLKTHFNVIDIACGGKDDKLVIFVTDPSIGDAAADYLHELTGLNRKLLRVITVNEIPKNSSGKTQYNKLNALCD